MKQTKMEANSGKDSEIKLNKYELMKDNTFLCCMSNQKCLFVYYTCLFHSNSVYFYVFRSYFSIFQCTEIPHTLISPVFLHFPLFLHALLPEMY